MAHFQQLKFVELVAWHYYRHKKKGCRVLEVGSWNVNGSVRDFFQCDEYIGIDVAAGLGVDVIVAGQNASFSSNYFDLVISCECFEHNEAWVETFSNMIRMLKPGGLCIVTCATIGRGEHGTPRSLSGYSLSSIELKSHYYKNLDKFNFRNTGLLSAFIEYIFVTNKYAKDLYFAGVKKNGIVCDIDLDAVKRASNAIKTRVDLGIFQELVVNLVYYLKYIIAKAIGERLFHNTIFLIKNF